MTVLKNFGQGDSSSNNQEKTSVDPYSQTDICNMMHIIENDDINFDNIFQKELDKLRKCKKDITNIKEKYTSSTDDNKEQVIPNKVIKPRHRLTTLYKTSDFQNSSLDAFSEENKENLIEKDQCLKNEDIKKALEKLEKLALRTPNVKTHRSDAKEKLRQRDKRISEKRMKVKLYNFMLPENTPKDIKVKCPPFKMLLEHTIGVLLLLFTQKKKADNLQLAHLKWAVFFLKALSKRKKQKELTICLNKLKEYLSTTATAPVKKNSSSLECKISVETVKFESIKQDSQIFKRIQSLLKKEKITKEGSEALNLLTKVVAKLKIYSETSVEKEKLPEEPYDYISKKVEKMDGLFNTILSDIKKEKLRLMSLLRTNHGSLAISLCKIERDLNEILDLRKNYLTTHNKLVEALQKLVTINDFLSVFEKRSSLESKFNDSVDSSLRKMTMIRQSLDNISESIYSNIIM